MLSALIYDYKGIMCRYGDEDIYPRPLKYILLYFGVILANWLRYQYKICFPRHKQYNPSYCFMFAHSECVIYSGRSSITKISLAMLWHYSVNSIYSTTQYVCNHAKSYGARSLVWPPEEHLCNFLRAAYSVLRARDCTGAKIVRGSGWMWLRYKCFINDKEIIWKSFLHY